MSSGALGSWATAAMLVVLAAVGSGCGPGTRGERRLELVFCCGPDNDLYRAMTAGGVECQRCETAAAAVAQASAEAGVLILADGYPKTTTRLDSALLEAAAAKRLRVYVEYPASVPGLEAGKPRHTRWERAVVASDAFGRTLKTLRILAIHDCHFVPMEAAQADIVVARVAGYDTAVFGLPKETFPILFEHPGGNLLVATTKLSQFVTARYAPAEAWQAVWHRILQWLCPGERVPRLAWTPTVRPSHGPREKLPDDVEARAFRRGVEWLTKSGLLVGDGEGKSGFREGYNSVVRHDGSQPLRGGLRNDCIGESAMAFAIGGVLNHEPRCLRIAANLNDYIYVHSPFAQGPRADPKSPSFGLLSWAKGGGPESTYYGDDNARSLLGQMATAALVKSDRWDKGLLHCILANLRTSGRFGFRGNALNEAGLQRHGWKHYYNGFGTNYAPHYEAHIWACYLWAYRHTGYKKFLERAKTAIRMTIEAYPDNWRWTNGIQQERARMLLPLAWLVRLDDTAEHRAWLRRMATDLVALQDRSGALQEQFGVPGLGTIPPPRSNESYGKHEAPIIQRNGDPAADMLYTGGFALIGLREAAAATGEKLYAEAENRLTEFLCRIQVRSEAHPELDGAWFRAFDFKRWEYWGSNADAGWGAWCIETGWKQAWIVAVLGLRQMRTSLWELTADSKVGRHLPELFPLMFPDGDDVTGGDLAEHLALGRPVKLAYPCDPRYTGGGDRALTNGQIYVEGAPLGIWQGYWEHDLDATIDLGTATPIQSISTRYLQQTQIGIFLPSSVEVAVSERGRRFRVVATLTHDVPQQRKGPLTEAFAAKVQGTKARYIRVRAKSLGKIPPWHHAKGKKAWLFVDEIVVK